MWLVGQWSNTLSRRESVKRKERNPGRKPVDATKSRDFQFDLLL